MDFPDTPTPRAVFTAEQAVRLVVFSVDQHRYALPLDVVERIVRAVAITALPKAPAVVLGIIDVAGCLVPVFNLRRRFRLPERPLRPTDQLLLARVAQRSVALVIDEARGVVERAAGAIVAADEIAPHLQYLQGVLQFEDGLVLIQDLEQFLSMDEAQMLDAALRQDPRHAN
jgi:purine-binding chemotaxis protein CheW